MILNNLKKKLMNGDVVFGCWNILPYPVICEIFSRRGFDFQILDMEHGNFNFENLQSCVSVIDPKICTPLVRIPGVQLFDSQKALDSGAQGLIFPQITGANECDRAVKMTKYTPVGTRGFNPFTRAWDFGKKNSFYILDSNETLSLIIIENKSAYDQLDEILKIKDLDVVYLGVYDMSCAFGKPGELDSAEIIHFVENGIKKIIEAGKVAGVMCTQPEQAKKYINLGAKFIVLGVDSQIISNSVESLITIKQSRNF